MKVVFLSARSVTLELEGNSIYKCDGVFPVFLNGKVITEKEQRNVFSLYDLEPETEYTVEANGQRTVFTTRMETVTLDVRSFNAKGDGSADDTVAIQAAILCCPKDGRVLIPAGTYCITALFLKSNISLEIAEGAVLLGATDQIGRAHV